MSQPELDRMLDMLARIYTSPGRVLRGPTVTDIKTVAPHLDSVEIQELIDQAASTERVSFLGPGARIRGALHVYVLSINPRDGGLVLYRSHCHRLRSSYACCPPPSDIPTPTYDYVERAIDYAASVWGDHLLWDRACTLLMGHIMDPREIDPITGFAVTKLRVAMSLDCTMAQILADTAMPLSAVIQQHIIDVQSRFPIIEEMMGHRNPPTAFYCIRCGGGLSIKRCTFCGTPIAVQNDRLRVEWYSSLPLAAETLLSGFPGQPLVNFEYPVIHARKAEFRQWAYDEHAPEIHRPAGDRERVISLETP